MRSNENVMFIVPHPDGGLIAYTAYLADEIRQASFQELAEISDREQAAVGQFIDALTSDLNMKQYQDAYRVNMMNLIEAKSKGETVKTPEVQRPKPVVSDNVFELLTASVLALKQKQKGKVA